MLAAVGDDQPALVVVGEEVDAQALAAGMAPALHVGGGKVLLAVVGDRAQARRPARTGTPNAC